MQLEELTRQWQSLDDKLDRIAGVEQELLRLAVTQPTRRRITRLAIWPAVDVALCVIALVWMGSFLSRHALNWTLAAPAVIVAAAALALLIDSVRQLVLISEIDWSRSVVAIQSSLVELRMMKIRQFKWVILLGPLVGFAGLVAGAQWLLDFLPMRHLVLNKLNPWWVASNFAFGILFVIFGHAILRFLSTCFGHRGWWQDALDAVAGTSMTAALAELTRWSSLSQDSE